MYQAYTKTKMRSEYLRQDFITFFIPHIIRSWPRSTLIKWKDLVIARGIYLYEDKSRYLYEVAIDLLYKKSHLGPEHQRDRFSKS